MTTKQFEIKREQVESLLDEGYTLRAIAKLLGFKAHTSVLYYMKEPRKILQVPERKYEDVKRYRDAVCRSENKA